MNYRQFIKSLTPLAQSSHMTIKDNAVLLPPGNLWLFGQNNLIAKQLKGQLASYDVKINEKGVTLNNNFFEWGSHSFIFSLNRQGSKDNQIVWVVASSRKSIAGLFRKLPHYGKYGYLVFKGDAPQNVVKGTWPSNGAGLSYVFKNGKYSLPFKASLLKATKLNN